jgi:hypothetical protein
VLLVLPVVAGWGTTAAARPSQSCGRVSRLPGWRGDAVSQALPALLSSCKI